MPTQVLGDPTRLRQILNNLLSNAVKFTGPQGVTWSVEGQEDGDLWWLEMRVTDSGPGIAPEKLERLFTPSTRPTIPSPATPWAARAWAWP
jgi:signal transduction histidine kinase